MPGYGARLLDEDGNPAGAGEVGNLQICGGSIASVYWNQREETRHNMLGKWFVTGDRYLVDKDGYFYFKGRSDDMLRVGGRWLAPQEVENTLLQHPEIAECAVVGYMDADELIKPYAFVVLKDAAAASAELVDEIKQFVKERIAAYKYPRWIKFTAALPKTAGGVVQRFALQEKLKKEGADADGQ